MAFEVVISCARSTSAEAAKALKAELGESAFLDTNEIQPGQKLPPEIFKHLLGSLVVVVFAEATYFQMKRRGRVRCSTSWSCCSVRALLMTAFTNGRAVSPSPS